MYGPGIPPPPPRTDRAAVLGLRVLFTVLPAMTLGVGAWGSVLRLALMRRRRIDWVLLPIVAVLGIGGFILIGASDESSPRSNVGAVGIFVCMLAVPVYFLASDILWESAGRRAPRPPAAFAHPYAGGGPIPARPATPPAMTGMGGMTGRPPYGYGPPSPSHPPTGPAAPQAAPPRISQVRAELDELSDYLRKEEGR